MWNRAGDLPQWDLNIVADAGVSLRFHEVNLVDVDRITLADADREIRAVAISAVDRFECLVERF